ncbi:hypothetical protein DIPPA_13976 [Diplonema papillatum]|nr:hypothetical protein DIPPA_13976 [Diplonema papillatum]
MKAFLLLLVVLVLLSVSSVGALKANWVENDVPKGGFSKRAREREAKLRGEKYDDPYAYSSTGAYATAQRVCLFLAGGVALCAAYHYRTYGHLRHLEAQARQLFGLGAGARQRTAPSRRKPGAPSAPSERMSSVEEEELRRRRIVRFAHYPSAANAAPAAAK